MGLIQAEITELRNLAKKVMDDEISLEKASIQIGIYNQVSKRTSQLIQIANMAAKENGKGKTWNRMNALNLLSDNVAIPIENDSEKIKCPEHGNALIDRGQCLDYSGCERNLDKCQQCEQFSVTRKYMMP